MALNVLPFPCWIVGSKIIDYRLKGPIWCVPWSKVKLHIILQRNAATLLGLISFYTWPIPKTSWARKSKNPWIHLPCKIDDVAEDNASQRFANCMRLQRRNARGDFIKTKKRKVALYLGTWKFGHALRFLTLPALFYYPLPFGLNLATLELGAWSMSFGIATLGALRLFALGPSLFLTFTISNHHSFRCTDPTTRVPGCVESD
jgi:hypothetical protein